MMRNLPPKATAGLARQSVSCFRRLPRPPARTTATVLRVAWVVARESLALGAEGVRALSSVLAMRASFTILICCRTKMALAQLQVRQRMSELAAGRFLQPRDFEYGLCGERGNDIIFQPRRVPCITRVTP